MKAAYYVSSPTSTVSSRVLCLLCPLILSLVSAASSESRQGQHSLSTQGIINGVEVEHPSEKYPFFALPTTAPDSDEWLGCGASLISPTYALSAAHCFGGGDTPCAGPKKIKLWFGDLQLDGMRMIVPLPGGKSHQVEAELIGCHPGWDGKCSHGHDMVLLKLTSGTPLPSWMRPVHLNLDGLAADGADDTATIIGFGLMEVPGSRDLVGDISTVLRETTVTIFKEDHKPCVDVFATGLGCSDDASEAPAINLEQQVCAAHPALRDSCAGDSGAPMMDANGVQIAIVSYGGGAGGDSGPGRTCGDPNWPGIYSRVHPFASFIRETVPDLP
mmetsp:Transcript_6597/g.12395  ORF Transcript_6597/g.12395 Transcript_6597/m.12395 type:complete len:330 (+) Transcript_6597:98-1087(+)